MSRLPFLALLLLGRVALADVDAETARWFHGNVVVQVGGNGHDTPWSTSPASKAEVDALGKDVFGHAPSLNEYAALVGAPDGSKVIVTVGQKDKLVVFVSNKKLGLSSERWLWKTEEGPVIFNTKMYLDDKAPAGMGTRILAHQVAAGRALGVASITTSATRDEGLNGYYTWPRLGFDGALPDHLVVPATLGHPRSVGEVMKTEAGRSWWKVNGRTVLVGLSPKEGAPAHQAYLREKGIEVPHDGLLSIPSRARAPGLWSSVRGALRR
jgi:hypothetical protein